MKLRDVLPKEALSGEYEGSKFLKYLDYEVLEEVREKKHPVYRFPFTHTNINVWWVLDNKKAVGWNENPNKGWSFPVVKLPKICKIDSNYQVMVSYVCPECNKQSLCENVSKYDICSSNSECDLCGDHGDITIDVKCPKCKHLFSIEIDSW